MRRAMVFSGMMALLVAQGTARAEDPPAKRGGGPRQETQRAEPYTQGMVPACAMFLMHAHPGAIKSRLKLNDQQVVDLEKLRTTFLANRIKLQSQVQQNQMKMSELFQAESPDENKILDLERRTLSLLNSIAEDGVKTYLKMLQTLDKAQRAELRDQCPSIAAEAMGRRRMRASGGEDTGAQIWR